METKDLTNILHKLDAITDEHEIICTALGLTREEVTRTRHRINLIKQLIELEGGEVNLPDSLPPL